MSGDVLFASGRELAGLIQARKISAREVMTAHLERIDRLNPTLNAIVAMLDDEECLALADDADKKLARGDAVGPLHGLPWAFKDLEDAAGFPNTAGSPIFKDRRPTADSLLVAILRRAGAIPIGKTNVPEFGMGSHTYNNVYGTTLNPWDTTKSAGGSSGGAGAALASGMLPLADGSDLGGSLRNPANFNNIVALRPTSGLAPALVDEASYGLGVRGPMARSVDDVAFLLGVMTGKEWPLESDDAFSRGTRVAWSPDLNGLPLDARVRDVLTAARSAFDAIGCSLDDVCPDLTEADDVFLTLRRKRSFANLGSLLWTDRRRMKPEAVEEIERGAALTPADIAKAEAKHRKLLARVGRFFDTHRFLVCAVNQVPPFDAMLDWPRAIDGVKMEHYAAWMKSAYWVSATLGPAISVPAGFTAESLPVGVQIVGRPGDDLGVLQIAHAFERSTGFSKRRPPDR
jgi:amidase